MTYQYHHLLTELTHRLDAVHHIVNATRDAAQLERSRLDALDVAVNAHARRLPELDAAINTTRKNLANQSHTCGDRCAKATKQLGDVHKDYDGVLDSLITQQHQQHLALDTLTQRLDQLAAYIHQTLRPKDAAHDPHADPVAVVDRPHTIVNPACTDHGRDTDPIAS